ncbi:MAG: inosine/xanthosine triphosphatase [Candidatus Korarchaeum sp.]|nr:inosine/xanthosine triphosphatase [Candidatus Korarchaeum sp.]MDW8035470.1 inosine/xanthosine triphosphatase [Candidatus Korarchaeum sp.]
MRLLVAVGSTNPVKVEAVWRAFSRFWEVEVKGVKVDSEVPAEPFGMAAVEGARNRARKALSMLNADFGVGIEGGIFHLFSRYYCAGFVWVERRDGSYSTGMSGWFECPRSFLPELLAGVELGDLMAKLSGKANIKMEEGAIGFFTRGAVNRVDLYTHGVLMALAKFVAAERWPR